MCGNMNIMAPMGQPLGNVSDYFSDTVKKRRVRIGSMQDPHLGSTRLRGHHETHQLCIAAGAACPDQEPRRDLLTENQNR